MVTKAPDPTVSRRARRVAKWAIAAGFIGFALKVSGWLLTDSDAVFSDALESIVNIIASVGAYLAISYAERPPDEDHPYGHGPMEFVSATAEGVLVAAAGLMILTHCVGTVVHGRPTLEKIDVGLALVLASAVLNGVMGFILLREGRKLGSAALEGDGRHLLSDLWTTVAVLIGLGLVWLTGQTWIDTAVAFGVGVLLAVVGTRVAIGGVSSIMGLSDREDHARIVSILERHRDGAQPAICSFASVRHRHQGRIHFVDMHLRVPREMTVADSHEIASAIENEVLAAIGEGTATAHMEPCGDGACARCAARRGAGA